VGFVGIFFGKRIGLKILDRLRVDAVKKWSMLMWVFPAL